MIEINASSSKPTAKPLVQKKYPTIWRGKVTLKGRLLGQKILTRSQSLDFAAAVHFSTNALQPQNCKKCLVPIILRPVKQVLILGFNEESLLFILNALYSTILIIFWFSMLHFTHFTYNNKNNKQFSQLKIERINYFEWDPDISELSLVSKDNVQLFRRLPEFVRIVPECFGDWLRYYLGQSTRKGIQNTLIWAQNTLKVYVNDVNLRLKS